MFFNISYLIQNIAAIGLICVYCFISISKFYFQMLIC